VIDRFRAGKRLWNPEDDAILRERFPHMRTDVLAQELRRTPSAVYARAGKLRLHKSPEYLASPDACRLRRDNTGGIPYRFRPGQVPPNKGLRRPGFGPGRMKTTQFRKGGTPHTWVPVGTEVVDVDGYRKRKIADDRTRPSRFNWKFVHVLIWEAAHGPLPKGHAVVFKNGDRSDLRLENLERLSRRALLARNSVHNLPKPLAEAVQLLGALNRKLRRRTPHEKDAHHRSA
jgi:hypothetical protein